MEQGCVVSCHVFNEISVFTVKRRKRAETRRPDVLDNIRAVGSTKIRNIQIINVL